MELKRWRDEEKCEQVFELRIPMSDLNDVHLDDMERQAVHWFEQQEDIEAALMALQIYVRKIEAQLPDSTSPPRS